MPKAKRNLTTRQRESKKISRKRAVRHWWKITAQRVMIALVALFILSLAAGGVIVWRSSDKVMQFASVTGNKFWQQTARLGFKVGNVYLEGRKYTPLSDIIKAMNIRTGEPILGLSLNAIRDNLQAIPRVKYAEVARVLPDQLHIRIVEREPVAIWQNKGKLHLIDDDGIAMEYIDPAQYKNLLVVVGSDAPSHIHELLAMLALEPEMSKDVIAALRIGERRWNVRFKNGIEVKLPEKNATQAWQSFAGMQREDHILDRTIQSVDMRLPDRIFVKYSTPSEITPVKYTGNAI